MTLGVVICSYSESRWDELVEAVASISRQSRPADELVVVIDHNDQLLTRARAAFPRALVIPSDAAPGLSGARNSGLRSLHAEIAAFLDDDACADERWLETMAAIYEDPSVIGIGGWVEPQWQSRSHCRLAPELYWIVGCSYRGLPTSVAEIRNPIGANMSFRREPIAQLGGFREGVGRVLDRPLGDEETELAIRVRARWPRARILHVPDARVHHAVPASRVRLRYLVARCWDEGRSKALLARSVGPSPALASERAYVARVLPSGVLAGMRDALHGDGAGIGRAVGIVIALAVTVAGYAYGRVSQRR